MYCKQRSSDQRVLLLPARDQPAIARQKIFNDWEQRKDAIKRLLSFFALGHGANKEIFRNGKMRKNSSTLRNVAYPSPSSLLRRHPRNIAPFKNDPATAWSI